MKNSIQRRILDMPNGLFYIVSFCIVTLFFFVGLLWFNKSANNDNTSIAIAGSIISFGVIFSLLFKLNKNIKLGDRARTKLAANEIKYRNLIENAGIVMYTTSFNGVITFASSKACKLTGYEMDEIIGSHFTKFIDTDWLDIVKDKYKSQVKNDIDETAIEFYIRTKQGELKWVEQFAVLLKENNVPSGFQCVTKDISERREMEEVLRKYELELVNNQERLQSILDNAASLIYIKDLEGKYVLVNKEFKEVLNVGDEIIGKTDFDFANAEDAQQFKDTDHLVIQTCKPVELETIIENEHGSKTLSIIKFPLVNAQNEIYGISGIATDVTEKVKQREEYIQALKIAKDAKQMQEQFLANMSHEIRTPMNGIQGMTDLLLETKLNDEQKDFAKTIKRSSDNLLVIINDILDFSKIKAGKLTIEKIDFDLNEILENIKAIFNHRIREKELSFELTADKNIPHILNGDPYRLSQILTNLIGNAIKFTHSGGITVKVSLQSKSDNEVVLIFSITDTGIGIEQDKINDIFESFTQASLETSRKYGGSGLGLAITRQLLQMQNGSITVKSQINLGSTFHFIIPYGYAKNKAITIVKNNISENYSSLLSGKKFLVAEDNEVNQKVIKHVLQKAGGLVNIANNGLEAIDFLKKKNNYDIIIMDLQMPGMDGYAATKYIRNVMNIKTPIMAMTASALKGEKAKCIEIGMNDYLSKPFDFNFLYNRIHILLNESAGNSSIYFNDENINDKLYDLSSLEEMDDNEYLTEILLLFLDNTPNDLSELQKAFAINQFDIVHKIAHKLKSSAGLFKAQRMLQILVGIEQNAKEEKKEVLETLIENLNREYGKIEIELKQKI